MNGRRSKNETRAGVTKQSIRFRAPATSGKAIKEEYKTDRIGLGVARLTKQTVTSLQSTLSPEDVLAASSRGAGDKSVRCSQMCAPPTEV